MGYCSSVPNLNKGNRNGTVTYGLQFNKIKIIPYNIYDLLTPIALALWIMGDGVLKLKQKETKV